MDQSQLHATIRQAVDQFLFDNNTSLEAKEVLLRYVEARPRFENPDPIIPLDEAVMRLELITALERTYDVNAPTVQRDDNGHFRFTTLQLSFLLLVPMERLRRFNEHPFDTFVPYLKLETYICFLVRGRIVTESSAGNRSSLGSNQFADTPASSSRNKKERDKQERDKCLARDGVCVLTGAAYPEVCHIVPHAINASQTSLAHYANQVNIMASLFEGRNQPQLFGLLDSALGCSDKTWNMLCLHPTLHDWWGRCYFGLKYLGLIPSANNDGNCTIKLQFHWMPRNGNNPRVYTQPSHNTIQNMFRIQQQVPGLITESRRYCSRRLETGQVFPITVPLEDATKMKVVLDIQWANAKLAAISGASGHWELLDNSPDKPEPGAGVERVEAWLDEMLPSESSY